MTRRTFLLAPLPLAAQLRPSTTRQIRANADAALRAGPWTVTSRRPALATSSPNDYYSEGPYWWPDPANPKGPYIRKDGQRNPARFTANRGDLGSMCSAVLALGMGALMLKDAACAARAAHVLTVWFLDPKTRMNPNLEYGQAVPGINTGRGTGLIDTVSFIHAVQGIRLLEQSGGFDAAVASGVREWFAAFTKWMTTSSKGLDEKKSGNNHATWWTAQVGAYAGFTRDDAALAMAWNHYRGVLVPTQIRPDGSCPREEARTNSLSYSAMNLDAYSVICWLARSHNVDLWTYRSPQGLSVVTAFHYLAPFLLRPDTWKKQQISRFNPDGTIFPALAGLGLKDDSLLAAYRSLPRNSSPWVQFVDTLVEA